MLILGRREYYCVDSLCDIEAMVFCFESVVIDNDLCKISVEHMSCYLKSFVPCSMNHLRLNHFLHSTSRTILGVLLFTQQLCVLISCVVSVS